MEKVAEGYKGGPTCMLINVYNFPAGLKVQPGNLVCENRKECKLLTVSSLSLSLSLLPWDWELGYASCQEHSFLVNWLPLFLPFSKRDEFLGCISDSY